MLNSLRFPTGSRVLAALVTLGSLTAAGPAAATVIWRGDMETGTLKQFQSTTNPSHISVVQAPVREGKYAARLDIHNGDAGNGSYRVELGYIPPGGTFLGSEVYYGWSVYIDPARPIVKGSHGMGFWEGETVFSQALAFQLDGIAIQFETRIPNQVVRWKGYIVDDLWHDFILHVKWSQSAADGFVELWFDNELVVTKKMVATVYPNSPYNFWELGFWRANGIAGEETIYIDAAIAATTLAEVQAVQGVLPDGGAVVPPGPDAGVMPQKGGGTSTGGTGSGGSGAATGTGGTTGTGAAGGMNGTAGVDGTGGDSGAGGDAGSAGSSPAPGTVTKSGCRCNLGGRAPALGFLSAAAWAALLLVSSRKRHLRRRPKR